MDYKNEELMGNEGDVEEIQSRENHNGQDNENSLYVEFDRPFVFEGEDTIQGIDMSGIENLTTTDLVEVEKKFYRQGITSFNPENTTAYAKFVAQRATGLPVELFDQIPAKEMLKIRKVVVNFFFS